MLVRLLICAALWPFLPLQAGDINAEINANYRRLTQAYQSLDADRMAAVYTEDSFYISPGKRREIIKGRDQIRALYKHYFAKVKKHKAQLQIRFRCLTDSSTTTPSPT